MKKRYLLEEQYNYIEDKLDYVQRILKQERDTSEFTIEEVVEDYRDQMLGANDICSIFEDMITNSNRAICIATCALRDLSKIKKEHPDIVINSCVRSEDPMTELANAAMLLSEFTPAISERIIYSIYASHELFNRRQLGYRMSRAFDAD